jgi:hypothetical protein
MSPCQLSIQAAIRFEEAAFRMCVRGVYGDDGAEGPWPKGD